MQPRLMVKSIFLIPNFISLYLHITSNLDFLPGKHIIYHTIQLIPMFVYHFEYLFLLIG